MLCVLLVVCIQVKVNKTGFFPLSFLPFFKVAFNLFSKCIIGSSHYLGDKQDINFNLFTLELRSYKAQNIYSVMQSRH